MIVFSTKYNFFNCPSFTLSHYTTLKLNNNCNFHFCLTASVLVTQFMNLKLGKMTGLHKLNYITSSSNPCLRRFKQTLVSPATDFRFH